VSQPIDPAAVIAAVVFNVAIVVVGGIRAEKGFGRMKPDDRNGAVRRGGGVEDVELEATPDPIMVVILILLHGSVKLGKASHRSSPLLPAPGGRREAKPIAEVCRRATARMTTGAKISRPPGTGWGVRVDHVWQPILLDRFPFGFFNFGQIEGDLLINVGRGEPEFFVEHLGWSRVAETVQAPDSSFWPD